MNYDDFKSKLAELISIKSISTDPSYKSEIQRAVVWLQKYFEEYSFDVEVWQGPNSNPVLFAKYKVADDAESVLVYGHYDVQPALLEDGWVDDPFTLRDDGKRLYARGVVDNKGQFLIHLYTVMQLITAGKLKYNTTFLIEGNEETSNDDIAKLIELNKEKIRADYVLISDGEIVSWKPVVEYSLRGGFNARLTYKTANNNLHSGIYGGAVPNAAYELSKFIAKLHDQNKVLIPGFYDNIDSVSPSTQSANASAIDDIKAVREHIGVKKFLMDEGNDLLTQTGLYPALSVTGIKSGYIGEGFSNIVPSDAEVRLNFRTVMSQSNADIIDNFKQFVAANTPDYVDFSLAFTNPYDAIKIDITSPMVEKVKVMLESAFESKVLTKPVGGGIPIVSDFKNLLGIDTLLVSLGNEDCNMHGVDENFHVETLKKGLRFSELFFSN